MIYLFLAPGFEEVEALAPLDILRRAGLSVTTVAISAAERLGFEPHSITATNITNTELAVRGAHGITVMADMSEAAFMGHLPAFLLCPNPKPIEAVILPGGMPGTTNLDASPLVHGALDAALRQDAYICAICAAPLILGKRGLLKDKRATCYPGFEPYLEGATVGGKVIRDGKIITAAGMGVAKEFGLEIVSVLRSPEVAGEISAAIQSL